MAAIGLLMLLAKAATATVYYVATTGNDSNPGTSGSPFATVQKAIDTVVAGDTITVKDGTYGCNGWATPETAACIGTSGTSTSWITLQAQNSGAAILDGQSTCELYIEFCSGVSNWIVRGFDIRNNTTAGIGVYASNNILISSNIIHNNASGIYSDASTYNLKIDANILHDNGVSGDTGSDNHNIDIYSTNTLISNNVFYGLIDGWHIQTAGNFSGTIANNTFFGPNPNAAGQILLWGSNSNLAIENNIFDGSTTDGICTTGLTVSGTCTIDHNLVYTAGSSMAMIDSVPSGCTSSSNTLDANPLFTSTATHNFRLQAGSPALGAGVTISSVPYDFTGTSRPGGGYDLGAYQTSGSSNPVPSISGLSPSSAAAGGAGFTLTVNGANFISGSTVKWNGSARSTTYVSASTLTATINSSDIASAVIDSVTVANPTPGGGVSSTTTFIVTASGPAPSITVLAPNSATAGGPAFTLNIFGTNFTSSSTVQWNGQAVSSVTYVSPTALTAAISTANIASVGTDTVTVVNAGGTSNGFAFAARTGTIYYVAKDGNDSHVGTSTSTAFLHISSGIAHMSSGDTLFVRVGTYAEEIDDGIPSGSAWSAMTTLSAYPNEAVTIQPPAASTRVFHFEDEHYIALNGFIMDATNVQYEVVKFEYTGSSIAPTTTADHILIENSELMNASNASGVLEDYQSPSNQFINLKVHDNGGLSQFFHGFYIDGSSNVVDHCTIYSNASFGVQVFNGNYPRESANSNVISNNMIYDNGVSISTPGAGIILSSGYGNLAFNNVIWGNDGGIFVAYNSMSSVIYNNTIYANNGGTSSSHFGIYLAATVSSGPNQDLSSGSVVQNNISYDHAIDLYNPGPQSSTTITTNRIGIDPLFVDAAGFNLHLSSSSPAVRYGTNLSTHGITTDIDRNPRPSTAAFDAGAYQYVNP